MRRLVLTYKCYGMLDRSSASTDLVPLEGPTPKPPQTRGPRTRCFAQLRTSSHGSRWELLISASSLLAFAKVTFMAVRKGRSPPFIFIPQLAVLLQNSQRFLFCFQTSLTRSKPSNYRGLTKPCGRTIARELCNNVCRTRHIALS